MKIKSCRKLKSIRRLKTRKYSLRNLKKLFISIKNKKSLIFAINFCFFSLFFYLIYTKMTFNTSFLEKFNILLLHHLFNKGKIVELPSYYHKTNTWALLIEKKDEELYFIVDRDCLGLSIFFALLTFTFSFPLYNIRKKIVLSLIYFVLVFFVLNPIRLITLYYLFIYYLHLYLIAHNFIWQISNIIITTFLILIPLKKLKSNKEQK